MKNATRVNGNLGVNLVDGVAVPGIKLVWLNHYGIEFPIRRVCPKCWSVGGLRAWWCDAAVDFLAGASSCCGSSWHQSTSLNAVGIPVVSNVPKERGIGR